MLVLGRGGVSSVWNQQRELARRAVRSAAAGAVTRFKRLLSAPRPIAGRRGLASAPTTSAVAPHHTYLALLVKVKPPRHQICQVSVAAAQHEHRGKADDRPRGELARALEGASTRRKKKSTIKHHLEALRGGGGEGRGRGEGEVEARRARGMHMKKVSSRALVSSRPRLPLRPFPRCVVASPARRSKRKQLRMWTR